MFTNFLKLLEAAAFWFIVVCVCCLVYSLVSVTVFGIVPGMTMITLDIIAIMWCYFVGTMPILYLGWTKIKNLF